MGIKVLSLFDGLSGGQIALKRAGIEVDEYYASEIEPWAIAMTQTHFPKTVQIGDVTKVRFENGILYTEKGEFNVGQIDLFMGGSPCQSFSLSGNGLGFEGKSGLFYEYLRLKNEVNAKYFLLENVRMKKVWENQITAQMGVSPILLNSSLVSAQNRPRLYWSNLTPDPILDKGILLKDILTKYPDKCYHWLKPSQLQKLEEKSYKYQSMYKIANIEGKSACVMTCMHNSSDNKIKIGKGIRHLSNEENERLQTLDFGWTAGIPESKRHFMIGNGWTVDIIVEFFKKIGQPVSMQPELFKLEEMLG